MRPTSAADEVDVIVVGLGGSGSAAAYWAARRGAKVVGLEQFRLGHARGSSHDHGHILRLAHESAARVAFAEAARSSWAEVSAEAGDELLLETGALELFPGAHAGLEARARALDEAGLGYERLDAGAVTSRWTPFALEAGVAALFQPGGGIVATQRAVAVHQRLACEYGADLRDGLGGLDAIEAGGGEVSVRAGGRTIRASRLILCAGAWSNAFLAQLGVRLALTVTREQVLYFEPRDPGAFAAGGFPPWCWHGERRFYGLPVFGEPALKAAEEFGGEETSAEARTFAVDEAGRARVQEFLRRTFPGAVLGEHTARTLLYAGSPDRRAMLGVLPGHPEVSVCVGSGEGFGLSTQFGRVLADQLAGEPASAELFPLQLAPRTAMAPATA